jgi:hypothetical protein
MPPAVTFRVRGSDSSRLTAGAAAANEATMSTALASVGPVSLFAAGAGGWPEGAATAMLDTGSGTRMLLRCRPFSLPARRWLVPVPRPGREARRPGASRAGSGQRRGAAVRRRQLRAGDRHGVVSPLDCPARRGHRGRRVLAAGSRFALEDLHAIGCLRGVLHWPGTRTATLGSHTVLGLGNPACGGGSGHD